MCLSSHVNVHNEKRFQISNDYKSEGAFLTIWKQGFMQTEHKKAGANNTNYKLFDIVFLALRIRHSLFRVAYPVLGDSGLTAILSSCISTEGTSIYSEAMKVTGLPLRIHFEDTTEMPLYLCI